MLLSLLFTILLVTLAFAAPAPDLAPRAAKDYSIRWTGEDARWLLGVFKIVNSTGFHPPDNGRQLSYSPYWIDRYHLHVWNFDVNAPGLLRLSGSDNKCLDSGLSPVNGTPLKVWDCYPGAWQQTWEVVGQQIRLKGRNLCLDVTDGSRSKAPQLWTCAEHNPNQMWKITELNISA